MWIFILGVPSQPRYHKRIIHFKKLKIDYKILSFERDYFKGGVSNKDYISLGNIESGKYFLRFFKILKAVKRVKRESLNAKLFYCFGLDNAFLAVLVNFLSFRKTKVVCEYSDIREVMVKDNIKSKLFRCFENIILKRCSKIVVTSPAYISEYFFKMQGISSSKFYLLENKLEYSLPIIKNRSIWNGKQPLVMGYFGLIRCPQSWEIIKKLAKKEPNKIKIIIRGFFKGIENYEEDLKYFSNIQYKGQYLVPDDLPEIYSEIDITWACSIFSDKTPAQRSMLNRYYEAGYFNVPLITQKNSPDGIRVYKFNIGLCIDLNNIEESIEKVLSIKPEDIKKWKNNFSKVSVNNFVYSDEHRKLLDCLQNNKSV